MLRCAAAGAAENARLEQIRILVLVDQNVVVHAGDAVGDRGRLLEHQRPEEQQIVVVDEITLCFRLVYSAKIRMMSRVNSTNCGYSCSRISSTECSVLRWREYM